MPSIYRYSEPVTRRGGLATAQAVNSIRRAVRNGVIRTSDRPLKEGERLDTIAFKRYGDSRLWWIIAAASNIGWWMQLPPGTLIKIPDSLTEVNQVI